MLTINKHSGTIDGLRHHLSNDLLINNEQRITTYELLFKRIDFKQFKVDGWQILGFAHCHQRVILILEDNLWM